MPIRTPSVSALAYWAFALGLLFWGAACTSPKALPLAFQLNQVSERHRGSFIALLNALENREHQEAEGVLIGLERRLQAEYDGGDEALRSEVAWQLDAAKRFGQILNGRKRLDLLEMHLTIEPLPAEEGDASDGPLWIQLHIRSRWPGALTLQPGSAVLEQESLYLGAGGEHSSRGRTQVFESAGPWELAPLGTLTIPWMRYQRAPIGGALALRDGFALRLGSGSILEEDERFPAEHWPVPRGLRVNLTQVLPPQAVPVEAWLTHLQKIEVGMPSVVERTVRLAPRDYPLALQRLIPLVQAATPELFERYQPALTWLCLHRPQPISLQGWRQHLANDHE